MIILKLHCLVKFALSIRAIPAFGFAEEEVKVLIEKRKLKKLKENSRIHVLHITLNSVIAFADCMTFSKVNQFPSFLWFWYCTRAPVPTPSVDK